MDNVDLPKMEKMMEELSGNSKNVMIKEVTSDGATIDNLKCKNTSEECTSLEECCSGICIAHPIWPPRP
ncbi:hypothetical protein P5E79_13580, partial [Clostridium perfringens]|nr:hypothetical protein [Clostridium perfringens]MDK0774945.1 hypothetical protein [Clostridium perfringens]